ncbi:MAG: hypothetical protein OXG05_13380 [Gammaproteobacteria bacterium]|nr:hypothetical protein [Gammaproteobacteria bacterium]
MSSSVTFRNIRASFSQKGFEKIEGSNHEIYRFVDESGRKTGIQTLLSRRPGGTDIDPSTQGKIARQMRLTTSQFRNFVDCSLSREEYSGIVAKLRSIGQEH